MKIKKALKAQGGFTLIEMLIVVAIIAILVAVSIPMVTSKVDSAKKATDEANMRAAKTAALLEYTENGITTAKFTGTNSPYTAYYDAAKGLIQAGKDGITPYGKQTDNTTKVVKITLTIPTSGAVTCDTTWD